MRERERYIYVDIHVFIHIHIYKCTSPDGGVRGRKLRLSIELLARRVVRAANPIYIYVYTCMCLCV